MVGEGVEVELWDVWEGGCGFRDELVDDGVVLLVCCVKYGEDFFFCYDEVWMLKVWEFWVCREKIE